MAETAVVILNWNGKSFLERFLPGVIASCEGLADIVVADNASTDHSVAWLRQEHPGVQLILNEENGGFAKGYNDALALLDHKYFLLLNSDIEVREGWLPPLLERIRADERIFAVQPTIRAYHKPEYFEYAGAAGGFIDRLGYPFCRGRLFDELEKDGGQYNVSTDIFWATGACMLVRADIFRELGGFDEHFFAHMEEIDLCWRAQSAGYRIVHEPHSHVLHIGGGTLPKKSARKTYLNFRNNLFLLYKNLPLGDFLPLYILRMPLDVLAAVKFLLGGGLEDFAAVIKGHCHFWTGLRKVQKTPWKSKLKSRSGVYHGSLVVSFYFRGKKRFADLGIEGPEREND